MPFLSLFLITCLCRYSSFIIIFNIITTSLPLPPKSKSPHFPAVTGTLFPKFSRNCSSNRNVSIVCGPSRKKAGTYPLKKPSGPSCAVYLQTSQSPLNSPGALFITRVFSTSSGWVNVVAMAPAVNEARKCVFGLSVKWPEASNKCFT